MNEFNNPEIPKEERAIDFRALELINFFLGPSKSEKIESIQKTLAGIENSDEKKRIATEIRNGLYDQYNDQINERREREITDKERYELFLLGALVQFYAGNIGEYESEMDELEEMLNYAQQFDLSDRIYELHYLLLK